MHVTERTYTLLTIGALVIAVLVTVATMIHSVGQMKFLW